MRQEKSWATSEGERSLDSGIRLPYLDPCVSGLHAFHHPSGPAKRFAVVMCDACREKFDSSISRLPAAAYPALGWPPCEKQEPPKGAGMRKRAGIRFQIGKGWPRISFILEQRATYIGPISRGSPAIAS